MSDELLRLCRRKLKAAVYQELRADIEIVDAVGSAETAVAMQTLLDWHQEIVALADRVHSQIEAARPPKPDPGET